MFISDLKANWFDYKLPQEFAELLPEVCPTCGAPTEMSDVLTGLHCSNPRCPDKVSKRIEAMCNALGVLGFGESTIESFVDYYGVTNPLNIFNLSEGMLISDSVSEEVSAKIISQLLTKKDFLLWEYVQIAQIPGVQTVAKDIFGGYNTLEEAYADIEFGGVQFIQKKLGISSEGEVSIRAMQVYNNLIVFKEDLFECIPDVNIITLGEKKEINIYCSDFAGTGFAHKKDFYSKINEEFGDRYFFNIVGSINKKLNYLIWGGADGTPCGRTPSKVEQVRKYQSQGCDIPIMTGQQFIDYLKNL